MIAFQEMLKVLRLGQCLASVRWHLWDIERAQHGLNKAFAALDQAKADLRIYEHHIHQSAQPPIYVQKLQDAADLADKVRQIGKRSKP